MKRTDLEALQLCKKHWETIIEILEKEGIRPEDYVNISLCDIKNRALKLMGKRPNSVLSECYVCDQADADCCECLLWPCPEHENYCGCVGQEYGSFISALKRNTVKDALQAAHDIVDLADKAIKERTE